MNCTNQRPLLFSLVMCSLMFQATVSVAKPPSFVIMIADCHGYHHSSVYGASEIQTPHMQQLADDGIRFDNASLASPACGPSRVAMFLGWTDTHTVWPPQREARIRPADVVIPRRIYDMPEAWEKNTRCVEAAERIDCRLGKTRQLIAKYLNPNNTLVMYMSDHGFAWPFAKWSLYETGIQTPMIVTWPGKI